MAFQDRTILVVEDNRDHALLVRMAARNAFPDIDVRVAGDGREGVAYLAGTPPFQGRQAHPYPDLIILDLIMPGMDGFAVLEWIGNESVRVTPPVAVLTSSVSPNDQEKALALGAKAFHTKPASFEELTEVVRQIVEEWLR